MVQTLLLRYLHRHNFRLRKQSLSKNNIGGAGAVALVQALYQNSTMKELHLSNSSFSENWAVAFALALHHNSTLRKLSLYNIGDAGAAYIVLAQTFYHNSTLDRLNLQGDNSDMGMFQHSLNDDIYEWRFCLTLPIRCKEYVTQYIQPHRFYNGGTGVSGVDMSTIVRNFVGGWRGEAAQ